ncbi:nucleotidyltransferase [Candidatus Shapirobacteria bacterium CG06_land_8_20_14_3_00_40_12]|uniref:Nucleotidyltransferase n=2 Tax=Candidatus Shapironibacteriota TaxID=1752721 RepID=A0A2M7TT57_9BACT|nr:MAG: nucleotidyltransferase [Candidatus Shapirobacteria bacterium CG06_land_8_20_14_3_00_40_12]PIZ58979.1 MAG: nucleotidyltransferase [Candidatus Shapirobacteria bacterium CG_4_10_14_0_2_um_filter_40_12]
MKVVNVGEVKKVILNNKQIIRNYGVNKLGLFGSFVRDEQKENSDVDLLVDFDKDQNTFKNFMGFADFMEETLGRKVDVVTLQSLSPFIGPYILKEVKYVEV